MEDEERKILYNEGIIPTAKDVAINYDFNPQFNKKMLKKIDKWTDKITDEERNKRTDLTNEYIVTIDGCDTKDFDDAIYVERVSHGMYRVLVSIADVTHFVKEDSLLDKEALKRGTSLYLIDSVFPMLPKKLSNDLCSLIPGKERLCLTVEMLVDRHGEVKKHKIYESIIKNRSRLTYENINNWFAGKEELVVDGEIIINGEQWKIEEMLRVARELQNILYNKRVRRGTLNFNFEEAFIELDENHRPINIKARDRGIGNRLIEELMILTNEVVAEQFYNMKVPFLYRIHETPKEEAIEEIYNFIDTLNYDIPRTLSSKDTQQILEQAKGKPEEDTVNLLLLHAMKKAKYFHEELGHFGLGCKYYSHFTSPIRRYPDLFIHRIIKSWLHGTLSSSKIKNLKTRAEEVGRLTSIQERKADEAERFYDEVKKCEYANDSIGEEFEGIVIRLNENQLTLKLDNTITGVLPLNSDKLYEIDEPRISIKELTTGRKIMIGDKIKVRIAKVYIVEQVIVFDEVEED